MRATEREERAAAADRPVALISGVGQVAGLAAAIAIRLACDGWDIASTAWAPYDERMPWGRQDGDSQLIDAVLLRAGARTIPIPADLADITAPALIFERAQAALGPVTAQVLCHCESVDSSLLDTTVESFDRQSMPGRPGY